MVCVVVELDLPVFDASSIGSQKKIDQQKMTSELIFDIRLVVAILKHILLTCPCITGFRWVFFLGM